MFPPYSHGVPKNFQSISKQVPKSNNRECKHKSENTLCITFQGCTYLSVSHLKLLKEYNNNFSHYVRI